MKGGWETRKRWVGEDEEREEMWNVEVHFIIILPSISFCSSVSDSSTSSPSFHLLVGVLKCGASKYVTYYMLTQFVMRKCKKMILWTFHFRSLENLILKGKHFFLIQKFWSKWREMRRNVKSCMNMKVMNKLQNFRFLRLQISYLLPTLHFPSFPLFTPPLALPIGVFRG